jgi:hypothetical protein
MAATFPSAAYKSCFLKGLRRGTRSRSPLEVEHERPRAPSHYENDGYPPPAKDRRPGIAALKDSRTVAALASVNRALGRFLRGAGFEPTGFDSADSFLADERRHSFGCVLVDVHLKGMSGLELQRRCSR